MIRSIHPEVSPRNRRILVLAIALLLACAKGIAQTELDRYNVVWTSQSKNSGESMPCGGGDIGLNVWVEKGDILFYMAKSGIFDQNNTLLKLGRMRLKLSPNPFDGGSFRQELLLREGCVKVTGKKGKLTAEVTIWVDVNSPTIYAELKSNRAISLTAAYESWRYESRATNGKENNQNSWKWAPQNQVYLFGDRTPAYTGREYLFFGRQNTVRTVFDNVVEQQGLTSIKQQLTDPLAFLGFTGLVQGEGMVKGASYSGKYADTDFKGWTLVSQLPSKERRVRVKLYADRGPSANELERGIPMRDSTINLARKKTLDWWQEFWKRSFIHINPPNADPVSPAWQVARNYQLFRYMVGCNSTGNWPTKFNGGLFTYDPSYVDTTFRFTPDFRNWGGGTHTAQNQRLVYWPMLKSGDFDLMQPQFNFYLNALNNAELRTKVYWNHAGASFTEQLENFGLPNPTEYGWKRPPGFDPGMEYNAWLEYEWDTVLEFCMMMLETQNYSGADIKRFVPFIESCLTFFDEHYQYLAKKRGAKALDADGKLVLYPGSAAETYKMAYNASSTVAALRTVIGALLSSGQLGSEAREKYSAMMKRIPAISFRTINGHPMISPALHWERVNNTESPQLYPVFPWGIYGVGKPGLDTARNTYLYDPDVVKFKSAVGWKQHNIFAARLGLASEAAGLAIEKLKDSGRRFPAFWGPGYDWAPDHNWGGAGMIGLQEMLLQTDGKRILLFPAWPKEWDVHFKLHAPGNTTVEATLKNGTLSELLVLPENRKKDVELMLDKQ